MNTAQDRMNNAKEMYEKVAKDNERLREIIVFLNEIPERMEPLSEYYFDQWLEDLTELEQSGFQNEVMNEDSIYEEIAAQYDLMKEILLIGAKYINKGIE